MMAKKKRIQSKAERDAMDARAEESIRRLRGMAEKAWAEIERKRAVEQPT
jgi:hypothetical protein